jgi:SagB-type dehydrogenase family enzyme
MKPFLYKFFHETTNDRTEGGLVYIPKNRNDWKEEWKTISYKEYRRGQKKSLPDTQMESSHFMTLKKRNSDVSKILSQKLSIEDISSILMSGYGIVPSESKRRTVPSGGSRFPLELYISVWGEIEGLARGNYHYDVRNHMLDVLHTTEVIKPSVISRYTNSLWATQAHGAVIISAVFERSIDKYGSRGYRYILLEAGHVGQNICLAAAERELATRPMGGVNEDVFEETLQLDREQEQIVYAFFI